MPALEAWLKKLPVGVQFRRIPVALRDDLIALQQLYFALELLGLVGQSHRKIFQAIHSDRQRLGRSDETAAFAAKHATNGKQLTETMRSLSVAGKVKQASALAAGYQIEHSIDWDQ